MRDEDHDASEIDSLCGCRSGENTIKSNDYRKSGGSIALMSLDGFLLNFSEVLHTESPTEVIIRVYDAFTLSETHWEYFLRFVVALGYDMPCNILHRLLSPKMQRMRDEDSVKHILYVWNKLGLERLFIDKMHIKRHIKPICTNDETVGLLHPKLIKFQGILNDIDEKVNEQQVEQLWVILNKLKCTKLLCEEKHSFSYFLKKQHHNHQNKEKLESIGYCWEPVTNWKSIRTSDLTQYRHFDFFQGEEELLKIKKIKDIERIDVGFSFPTNYRNVWISSGEQQSEWRINEKQKELIEGLTPFVRFRFNMAGIVTVSEVQDYVIGWKGKSAWDTFSCYLTDFVNLSLKQLSR